MTALPSPALADPPAGAIATMAATRARRLRADLTSSQPTKDDHRGIRLNKTEIDAQQNSRAGVAFFPAVQPRAMPRRYGASYRRGGLAIARPRALGSDDRRMAATNKCLAQSNKSHTRGKATKKQNRQ